MKQMFTAAVMVLAFGSMAFAAGPNGNQGKGNAGAGTPATVVKPADSQRRDGTFLNSGVTANGSTVRPSNGKGLMDGTGPRK
jgi:hypothetical protein